MAGVESDRTVKLSAARLSGIAALGFVIVACSTEALTPRDSAANQSIDAPADTTSDVGIVVDAAPAPVDGQVQAPAGYSFPDPPAMSCVADAGGAAGECALAPSACGEPQCPDADSCPPSRWVVFYGNARCVNGSCQWDRAFYQCSGYGTCHQGACSSNSTTLP